MQRSVRRVALVTVVAVVALTATACGPETGEALFNAWLQVVGSIVGIGLVLLALLGGGGGG